MKQRTALAHANIALAKYWGKSDEARNLPAVPSLSLTLAALRTRTTVTFDPSLAEDLVTLDGRATKEKERKRVVALLDRVRALASVTTRARVESANEFPTAAGLASSASGFAALALASSAALGLELSRGELSAIARQASVSAARSLYGGWATLGTNAERAGRLAPESHFPVEMVIALTRAGEKSVGSTEGMIRTAKTSPYYAGWLDHAPRLFDRIRQGVLARDIEGLGPAVEASALSMHASMFAADPAIVYFSPVTIAVMERVRELRAGGTPAFYTMDAGPHVKVLTEAARAAAVAQALGAVPGVLQVIRSAPGGDASLLDEEGKALPIPETP